MRGSTGVAVFGAVLLLAAVAVSAQTTDVVFVNNTGATIYFLYASPMTADTWGDDILGSRVLANGDSYKVRLLTSEATYDIRAVDSNDNEFIIWSFDVGDSPRIEISPDNYVGLHATVGGDSVLAWLDIVNKTNYTIFEIYVAPSEAPTWDVDDQLLQDWEVIHHGETYRVEVDVEGFDTYVYDVMLVDEEGDRYIKWDINLEISTRVTYTLDDLDWD